MVKKKPEVNSDGKSLIPIDKEKECSVPVPLNQSLVFPSASVSPEGVDYVRFVDKDGYELVIWVAEEWQESPEEVMGAIMACIQNGVSNI